MTQILRIDAEPFLVLSAMICARSPHQRSMDAFYARIRILSEPPSPASAFMANPYKKKKRLQPWDNCKRLKFGGYLPHLGNRLTPSVELTTWYLVAPHSLLQPRRQKVSAAADAL
jgi:hypothetical protein